MEIFTAYPSHYLPPELVWMPGVTLLLELAVALWLVQALWLGE